MFRFNLFHKKKDFENKDDYYDFIVNESKKDKYSVYSFDEKYANQEDKLYKMYGSCDVFTKKLKLIVISDTHNSLNDNDFQNFIKSNSEYDVCLLLGDHSSNDIQKILKYVDKEKIYCLLGNHDYNYIKDFNLKDLNGQIIYVNGVSILGIQGSFKYKPSDFPSFTQKESIEFLNNMEQVDILVSHDNRFDSSMQRNPAHQGLFGITYYLFKNKIPYHIHGHIHNPYRKKLNNGTQEISVYMYEYIEL